MAGTVSTMNNDSPAMKLADFERLRGDGLVSVNLDPRAIGVVLPKSLQGRPSLALNFGHAKGKGDLQANAWGLRETLRFGGVWQQVAVPWSAVVSMAGLVGASDGQLVTRNRVNYCQPDATTLNTAAVKALQPLLSRSPGFRVVTEDEAKAHDGAQIIPFRKKSLPN